MEGIRTQLVPEPLSRGTPKEDQVCGARVQGGEGRGGHSVHAEFEVPMGFQVAASSSEPGSGPVWWRLGTACRALRPPSFQVRGDTGVPEGSNTAAPTGPWAALPRFLIDDSHPLCLHSSPCQVPWVERKPSRNEG